MKFYGKDNSDAIKNVSIIKGGMPAQYGGRLSSVLDISMKEGNNQKFQVEGGIGLIASRISLQGPIKKDKANAEFNFLRLIIQEHAPKVVDYRNDIENDKCNTTISAAVRNV